MSAPVLLEIDDGVAVVTVDNPPVNTLSDTVLTALESVADLLATDATVRVVVLTGAGDKAFVAGADLEEFRQALGDVDWIARHTTLTRRVLEKWQSLPQPVIAAAQASAVGGGLEVALVCDLIVADPGARFGLPEVKLGLIPGAGGTQRLPLRIPLAVAKELIFLGKTIDAEEARRLGLVNRVTEPGAALDDALKLASRLAAQSPIAVRAAKKAIAAATTASDVGLALERTLFFEAFCSADAQEGCDAFLENRTPVFRR